MSKDECKVLYDALGAASKMVPQGCENLLKASDDPFAYRKTAGGAKTEFEGEDKEKHRNSWLWPRLARRVTVNSPTHVSNWRKPVEIDEFHCANIYEALKAKYGDKEAAAKLPQECPRY